MRAGIIIKTKLREPRGKTRFMKTEGKRCSGSNCQFELTYYIYFHFFLLFFSRKSIRFPYNPKILLLTLNRFHEGIISLKAASKPGEKQGDPLKLFSEAKLERLSSDFGGLSRLL